MVPTTGGVAGGRARRGQAVRAFIRDGTKVVIYEHERNNAERDRKSAPERDQSRRSRSTGLPAMGSRRPAHRPGPGILAAGRGGTSFGPAQSFAKGGGLWRRLRARKCQPFGTFAANTSCGETRAPSSRLAADWRLRGRARLQAGQIRDSPGRPLNPTLIC
jgi:hypothetical protein